jgi:hypothetical protein
VRVFVRFNVKNSRTTEPMYETTPEGCVFRIRKEYENDGIVLKIFLNPVRRMEAVQVSTNGSPYEGGLSKN